MQSITNEGINAVTSPTSLELEAPHVNKHKYILTPLHYIYSSNIGDE